MADKPSLLERVTARTHEVLHNRGYAARTQEAYVGWIRRFLLFHRDVHPMALERSHAESFLEHLGRERRLAPKTRNLAASALAFLYTQILGKEGLEGVPRVRGHRTVPVVMSRREVRAVLQELRGRYRLIAGLMYGTGMRVGEVLGLRLKDLDFELAQLSVRNAKGSKDRYALFPERLQPPVRRLAAKVAALHRSDRGRGPAGPPSPARCISRSPGPGGSSAGSSSSPRPGRAPTPRPVAPAASTCTRAPCSGR